MLWKGDGDAQASVGLASRGKNGKDENLSTHGMIVQT
jgi:hypothetical protein